MTDNLLAAAVGFAVGWYGNMLFLAFWRWRDRRAALLRLVALIREGQRVRRSGSRSDD